MAGKGTGREYQTEAGFRADHALADQESVQDFRDARHKRFTNEAGFRVVEHPHAVVTVRGENHNRIFQRPLGLKQSSQQILNHQVPPTVYLWENQE